VTSKKKVLALLKREKNSAASLFFAAMLSSPEDGANGHQTFDQLCPVMQLRNKQQLVPKQYFALAELVASRREHEGFFALAECYREGYGCVKDTKKGKEYYLISAQLGHVFAMVFYSELLDESDPQRWFWSGQAAALGDLGHLILFAFVPVANFTSRGSVDDDACPVVYQIGKSLNGHVDFSKATIFGNQVMDRSKFSHATFAILFYKSQALACRFAVDT
jgi:TPR repeat protein